MAAAACSTWISKLEPPVWVESVQRAWMPRYSASSIEAAQPGPMLVNTPSTSARVSPASSSAARTMRASMDRSDPSIIPDGATSSATPTMAAAPRSGWLGIRRF